MTLGVARYILGVDSVPDHLVDEVWGIVHNPVLGVVASGAYLDIAVGNHDLNHYFVTNMDRVKNIENKRVREDL